VLKEQAKAKRVYAFASHGLFSGKALENIKNSAIEQILTTNTIPAKPGESEISKIKRISVGMKQLIFFLKFSSFIGRGYQKNSR